MKRATWLMVGVLTLAGVPGPGEIGAEETAEVPPPGPDNVLAELLLMIQEGQYSEAVDLGRGYLARAEEKYGAESVEAAAVMNLLVDALWRGGRTDEEVFALARRALSIRERELGPDDVEVGDSANTLANLNWMIGDYAEASKLYRRCLAILETKLGPDHPDVAGALNNVALTHYMLGEYAAARENYERALAIREKVFGPEHPMLASTLMNLASLFREQAGFDEARGYFFRALAIIEREYGPDHPSAGMIRSNIGTMYSMEGRFEDAIAFYRAAVEIALEHGGEENPDAGQALGNLGFALWHTGELNEAREAIGRAVAIQEKTLDPYDPDLAGGLINHGYMLYEQGRHAEARSRYTRALEIRKKRFGLEHFDTAEAMFYLAELSLAEDNVVEGLELALEAEEIARRQFQQIAASLTEQEALAFELIRKSGTGVALECLVALGGDDVAPAAARVWDQLIRSRAMVMDEVAFRKRTLAMHSSPEVDAGLETLALARDDLAGLIVAGAGGEGDYLERLRDAQSHRIEAERALAELSGEFRQRMERRETGLGDVTAELPPKTSLVAFFYSRTTELPEPVAGSEQEAAKEAGQDARPVVKGHYVAFVLEDRESKPTVVPLRNGDEIDALIQEWKREAGARPPAVPLAAKQAEARYRKAGDALRRAIWDPVAEAVDLAERVIVVPDGSIHMVSLGALPTGETGYMAEAGPALHYVSAERDLVLMRSPRGDATGLLALGGADFDRAPGTTVTTATRSAEPTRAASCDGLASLTFSPIHSSRAEAEQVTKLWRRKTGEEGGEAALLTGKDATEASLRQAAPGHRVIHLATHGFFAQEACTPAEPAAGSRELYGGRDDSEARRLVEDPFLLAGLALAGANSRTDGNIPAANDGILTAEEVAAMDFSGVEWVVLSACETGTGKVQTGEGVLGLRRAFETAGAATLIMSLWAVDDEATRSWMEHLYRHRLDGAGTVEAVRSATVETIAARRDDGRSTHPFYWGAFVAAGDWR